MRFYKNLFIGFLFVSFDFWIDRIDIIPDSIGYGFIVYAFLGVAHSYKKIGAIVASILIAMSITIQIFIESYFMSPQFIVIQNGILMSVAQLIEGTLLTFLIGLIIIITKDIAPGQSLLAPITSLCWYLLSYSLPSFVLLTGMEFSELSVIAIGIISLSIQIWFFVFLWKQHAFQLTQRQHEASAETEALSMNNG